MNIHKVKTSPIVKPRDLNMIYMVTLTKYDVTKGNVINHFIDRYIHRWISCNASIWDTATPILLGKVLVY